jgi:hypothetical protein
MPANRPMVCFGQLGAPITSRLNKSGLINKSNPMAAASMAATVATHRSAFFLSLRIFFSNSRLLWYRTDRSVFD